MKPTDHQRIEREAELAFKKEIQINVNYWGREFDDSEDEEVKDWKKIWVKGATHERELIEADKVSERNRTIDQAIEALKKRGLNKHDHNGRIVFDELEALKIKNHE